MVLLGGLISAADIQCPDYGHNLTHKRIAKSYNLVNYSHRIIDSKVN
jgi:hypothetical protein